jgi:hypothetical protein
VAARPWTIVLAVLAAVLLLSALLAIALSLLERRVHDGGAAHDTAWHVWDFVRRTVGADDLDDRESTLMRIATLAISLLGVALVGTVAGSAAEGIGRWMRRIQGGRTPVLERRHTILVGWSPATIPAIREMIEANRSEGGRTIVVLADVDQAEMDAVIRERIPASARHGSRIVTRRGDCTRRDDLVMVGVDRARAIVLVPPAADSLHRAIGCMAALKSLPRLERRLGSGLRSSDGRLAVVAPVGHAAGQYVLEEAGDGLGTWVPHEDLMARLTAHIAAHPGACAIVEELLGFHGGALYLWPTADRRRRRRRQRIRRNPGIANVEGLTFFQVQCAYVRGCPVGIRTAEGETILNPPAERVICPGDQLIVAASDNSPQSIRFERRLVPSLRVPEPVDRRVPVTASEARDVLVIGAGNGTASIVAQLASHLPHRSTVRIASSSRERLQAMEAPADGSHGVSISTETRPPDSLDDLRALVGDRTGVILLCPDGSTDDRSSQDMETIHRLLQVRTVLRERKLDASIAVEVLDDRDLELADVVQPDDVIVAERLVSLYCVQLAYQPLLRDVFEELLDPTGAALRLRSVEEFLPLGRECDFAEAIAAASGAGMTLIGYRTGRHARSREDRFGIELNPLKKRRFIPEPGDCLIVLAGRSESPRRAVRPGLATSS